jgi:hypothetical protein
MCIVIIAYKLIFVNIGESNGVKCNHGVFAIFDNKLKIA